MPYQAPILIDPQASSPSRTSVSTKSVYSFGQTHRHSHAAQAHVWAQSLANTCSSPECSKRSVWVVRFRLSRFCSIRRLNASSTYPFLFLSRKAGKTPCRYVHVQIKSRTTRRSVWNLRMPSWVVMWSVCEDLEFFGE